MSGDVSRSQAWAIVLLAVCVLILAGLDWLRAGQIKLLEEDMQTARNALAEHAKGLRDLHSVSTGKRPPGRPRKPPSPEGDAA